MAVVFFYIDLGTHSTSETQYAKLNVAVSFQKVAEEREYYARPKKVILEKETKYYGARLWVSIIHSPISLTTFIVITSSFSIITSADPRLHLLCRTKNKSILTRPLHP